MAHDYRVEFNGKLPLQQADHADSFVFPAHHTFDAMAAADGAQAADHGHHQHDHSGDHPFWHGQKIGAQFIDHINTALDGTHLGVDHLFSARFDVHVDIA